MAPAPLTWVLTWLLVSEVRGHGKLTVPASRNQIDGAAGCAHCLNGGGPCGDGSSGKFLDYYAGPQATWTAGSIVPITVHVTAHHRGHYEMRVCDQVLNSSVADPDACLNKWVLERASPEEAGFTDCQPGDQRPPCVPIDPRHPERFYLPPSGEISGTHTFYVKVPTGLQCSACTLQWHWWSANSCIPASDYGCFRDVLQSKGYWVAGKAAWWTVGSGSCPGGCGSRLHCGCGEQFWNCADISVRASGQGPSTTASTTATTATAVGTTTTAPMTPATTSSTSTATTTTASMDPDFVAVDGGIGRACRGASAADDSAEHYMLFEGLGLPNCKFLCTGAPFVCTGLEYNDASAACSGISCPGGQCKVWSRPEGVGASVAAAGSHCYRYGEPGTTTTATSSLPTTTTMSTTTTTSVVSMTTTSTTSTVSTPASTTTALSGFQPVDGGNDRACRGASASDNAASHYTVEVGAATLEDCKSRCVATAACRGIEFNTASTRCEVWTRPAGIEATIALAGYTCLSYAADVGATTTTTTLMAGLFHAVDGGVDRACRGSSAGDNSASYYSLQAGVSSLSDCKARCMANAACRGIEYNPSSSRCEVWTRTVEASVAVSGFSCFSFDTATGCRVRHVDSGATPEDCKRTCDALAPGVWPCSSDGPCDCASGPVLLSRRTQLRGRSARVLAAGVGLIQQNSSTATVLHRDEQVIPETCDR